MLKERRAGGFPSSVTDYADIYIVQCTIEISVLRRNLSCC